MCYSFKKNNQTVCFYFILRIPPIDFFMIVTLVFKLHRTAKYVCISRMKIFVSHPSFYHFLLYNPKELFLGLLLLDSQSEKKLCYDAP
jgi:hypothetical protein